MSEKDDKDLTLKIKKFCGLYAACGDEIKAAVLAGYPADCAKATAKRLLKRPDVQERINKEIEKLADKYKIAREDIIKDLKEMKDWDLFDIIEIQESSKPKKIEKPKENATAENTINAIEEKDEGKFQTIIIDVTKLRELKSKGLTKYISSISESKYGIKIEIPKKTEIIDIINKMNGYYIPEKPKDDTNMTLVFNCPRPEDTQPGVIDNNGQKVEIKFTGQIQNNLTSQTNLN